MARWKELPPGLGERERQLLVQLRRLKDHNGLSLAALAGRTGYSRSSWERYLNGKKPVPRQAVEELARVCGADPTRLVVLHEVALGDREPPQPEGRETDGTGGTASAPAAVDRPGGAAEHGTPEGVPDARDAGLPEGRAGHGAADGEIAGRGEIADRKAADGEVADGKAAVAEDRGLGRSGRAVRVMPLGRGLVVVALVAAAAFVGGLLTAGAWRDSGPAMEGASTSASGYRRGQTYDCEIRREKGELRAGHSTTREMLLDTNSTGFDVVETQCLLREHGVDPQATDGLYDERTKEAVKRFQKERGLVVDGIVGPDTWRELRR
ncbi:helix-turn-helix domain-containing protein [Streptomyces sp. NPDC045431]|uniref:helix-turn-helix domain-containing protein n=1 Tax=Streptomyces sp. NPDC045431 TaxID=3155613 RepID=UPI003405B631